MIENRTMQVRCPYCNGRLFDLVLIGLPDPNREPLYNIIIKCWKCRQKLNIENRNLVQAPRIQKYGVGV